MKEEQLKCDLCSMYKEVPALPDTNAREQLVTFAREIDKKKEKRISFWQFYWSQFRFIRKKVWIIQLAILFLIVGKLMQADDINVTFSLISASTPLILLTGVEEILRTFAYGTYEIEISTMYTAKQVMLARAGIIGGMDIVCITFIIFLADRYLWGPGVLLFFYLLVPFLVTCFGCLWLMNRVKSRDCLYYCYGYGGSITGITVIMTLYVPHLYQISLIWGWMIVFFVTVTGIVKEVYRLNQYYSRKLGGAVG